MRWESGRHFVNKAPGEAWLNGRVACGRPSLRVDMTHSSPTISDVRPRSAARALIAEREILRAGMFAHRILTLPVVRQRM